MNTKFNEMTVYYPSEQNVKPLGRTAYIDGIRWGAFSGSGVEFAFFGHELNMEIYNGEGRHDREEWAHIGVFINGAKHFDLVLETGTVRKISVIKGAQADIPAIVSVRKLSESTYGCLGIGKIEAFGTIEPTEKKRLKLEFIGDSLTCGLGIAGVHTCDDPLYLVEDATLSYAVKTAEYLDADASLVCVSGFGIVSGWTGNGEQNTQSLLPPYYESLGFGNGTFGKTIQPKEMKWNFSDYVPDIIVLNLGTNDASWTSNLPEREEKFIEGYIHFVLRVRELNPKSHICCLIGCAGPYLVSAVQKAVEFIRKTDENLSCCVCSPTDVNKEGVGGIGHPSVLSNVKYARELTEHIRNILKNN